MGGGDPQEIAKELRQIADDIAQGNHVNRMEEKGTCDWEDKTLMTTISEDDE